MRWFENRKTKGAISIFLLIILIPSMLLSAVLIDGSRLASARAMAQEATDLAAVSAMAAYNQDLKDEFGLFAVEDNDRLEEIYKESLSNTLLAYGLSGDESYSERLWSILKTSLTGETSYAGENFLNLYDFSVEDCRVQPDFCLAQKDVLESQMVEYAKFRGIYVMADRLSILQNLSEAKKQAEDNRDTADAMEDKMDVDEKNGKTDELLSDLRKELEELNQSIEAAGYAMGAYAPSLKARLKELRAENTDLEDDRTKEEIQDAKSYSKVKKQLKEKASEACSQASKVKKLAETVKKSIEASIDRLEAYKKENQAKAGENEDIRSLVEDAEKNIQQYKEHYLPSIQQLLDDEILNQMAKDRSISSDLDKAFKKVDEAAERYIDEIEELKEEARDQETEGENEEPEEEEITEYYFYYLGSDESTTDIDAVVDGDSYTRHYNMSVFSVIAYFANASWDPQNCNPASAAQGTGSTDVIDEDFASSQSGKTAVDDKDEEEGPQRGEIPKELYEMRPSKTYQPEEKENGGSDFYNRDGDLSASRDILEQGKNSMLLELGETVRDDVLGLSYMFGTFKTRLTGVDKFSAAEMSEADKESFYMPKWRYAHEEGELDMRFEPKKDRNTVLRGEIEYLIFGNRSDAANENAVYAVIMAERLANNLIAMYGEKNVINPSCHAAAAAASAATMFVIPESVFFWIFLTAWATAETLVEMNYLISGGYRIPLLKTKKNLLLVRSPKDQDEGMISNYGKKGIFVSYEDYLLLLLLLKGSDKRVMRTADLIEINMKENGDSDFSMAAAYTTLRADTELSIRYLFGNTKPFQSAYEEGGYSGRIHFSNTIYQSY